MQRKDDAAEWLREHDPRYASGPAGRGYYTFSQEDDWNPRGAVSRDALAEQGIEVGHADLTGAPIDRPERLERRCERCGKRLVEPRRGPAPKVCRPCSTARWRERRSA